MDLPDAPTLPHPAAHAPDELRPSPWTLEGSPGDELPPGTLVAGKYAVLAPIGRGGWSVVHRVHARHLDRPVALKVQRRDARGVEQRARWLRECRLLVRVQHASIPKVYELGELPDGRLAIALELVEGPSLLSLLAERGRLAPPHAAMLAVQLLSALSAVHEQSIVHRDVKPANLVVSAGRRGATLKLVDFGVAKPVGEGEKAITRPADVVGTPGYLAPEQLAAGSVIDGRTDLFAAGVVLFEMLAGERLFGDRDVDVLRTARRGASLDRLPASVSPELRALLARLVAFSPDDRPASAIEALAHLIATPEAEASERAPSTLPPPPPRTVLVVSPSAARRALWSSMIVSAGADAVPLASAEAAVLLADGSDVPVSVLVDRCAARSDSAAELERAALRALIALPTRHVRKVAEVVRSRGAVHAPRSLKGRIVELTMPVTESDVLGWLREGGTA